MKKISLIFALAVLAACNTDENTLPSEEAIRLKADITAMSRGVSMTQQDTKIESGQQVGLTIDGAKATHNNVAWTAGSDGELTNTGDPLYWGSGDVTIYAYHPYQHLWKIGNEVVYFSVYTDQSDAEGYLNSDLLWATKTASKTAAPVALNFVHKLAKINVKLTSSVVSDLSDATISICNVNLVCDFNPVTGSVVEYGDGNIGIIRAGITTTTAATASAIIVPQTIAAGKKFIQVELGGKYYYYNLPAEKTFASGNSYTYTLDIQNAVALSCTSTDIAQWTDEPISGVGEEETYRTITLSEPGTLSTALGSEIQDVTMLKINGPINGLDVKCLRQMLGAVEFEEAQRGKLTTLDLTDASIMGSEDVYYEDDNVSGHTSTNMITFYMFYKCANLETIMLPNNVTKIVSAAFRESKRLTYIAIPASVTEIGEYSFMACHNLTEMDIDASNAHFIFEDGVLYNKDKTVLYMCTIGKRNVTIPSSVKEIARFAFDGCEYISEIDIPDNVTSIGVSAFDMCGGLVKATIGSGVTSIGESAFWYCKKLKEIHVDESNTAFCSVDGVVYSKDMTTLVRCPQAKKQLIIPGCVTSVVKNALAAYVVDGEDIPVIYCHAATPFSLDNADLYESTTRKLYVPESSLEAYKEAWGKYFGGGVFAM